MGKTVTTMVCRPLVRASLLACCYIVFGSEDARASGPLNCSTNYEIRQAFANGAEWEMCWERRNREGVVFFDVHYTTTSGVRRKIFYQANVAQIHVPYDDDGSRFHDVSDFGLGTTENLNDLSPSDCPGGTRLIDSGKRVICRALHGNELRNATGSDSRQGEFLSLFSVSHVGAYNYIPMWTFFDDGTIEIGMGATGTLQRYDNQPEYGWSINDTSSPVGISHLHNYYWRLDFDIVGNGSDDVVEEIEFVAEDGTNRTRARVVTEFDTEVARSVSGETKRFWRVKDVSALNIEGVPISYEILPLETGHRDTGPSFEPFTFNDVYVTKSRACEKFASHNPADGPGGCAANGDVSSFVNGESLLGEDPVVWFGITFHHIPRDEDEPFMHAHWNRFQLAPRDWSNPAPDFDGDGTPDFLDWDDDNDGISDEFEIENDLDPFDPSDASLDPDHDGLTNLEEYLIDPGMDPNNPDTDGDSIGDARDDDPLTYSNQCTGGDAVDRTYEGVVTTEKICAARRTILVKASTDVQEPNGYLQLISPAVSFESGFSSGRMVVISEDPCTGCTLPILP